MKLELEWISSQGTILYSIRALLRVVRKLTAPRDMGRKGFTPRLTEKGLGLLRAKKILLYTLISLALSFVVNITSISVRDFQVFVSIHFGDAEETN